MGPSAYPPYYILYETDTVLYYQFGHLINVKGITNTTLLITDNVFRNLSVGGPLINFREQTDSYSSNLALYNNSFNLIMGYLGTNVLQVIREFSYLNRYDNGSVVNYFQLGGGILIQANNFSEIGGCYSSVDTSLVSISVNCSIDSPVASSYPPPLPQRNLVATQYSYPNWY